MATIKAQPLLQHFGVKSALDKVFYSFLLKAIDLMVFGDSLDRPQIAAVFATNVVMAIMGCIGLLKGQYNIIGRKNGSLINGSMPF